MAWVHSHIQMTTSGALFHQYRQCLPLAATCANDTRTEFQWIRKFVDLEKFHHCHTSVVLRASKTNIKGYRSIHMHHNGVIMSLNVTQYNKNGYWMPICLKTWSFINCICIMSTWSICAFRILIYDIGIYANTTIYLNTSFCGLGNNRGMTMLKLMKFLAWLSCMWVK